jgi:hypothetical protein
MPSRDSARFRGMSGKENSSRERRTLEAEVRPRNLRAKLVNRE